MARSKDRLTDVLCRRTKCPQGKKEILLNDGGGLLLRIKAIGSKTWIYRYKFDGKEKRMGLGVYPAITLADARSLRDTYYKRIKDNVDPMVYREKDKVQKIQISKDYQKYKFSYVKDHMIEYNTNKKKKTNPWSDAYVKRMDGFWRNYITPAGYSDYSISEITEDVVNDILQYTLDNPFGANSKGKRGGGASNKNTMGKVMSFLNLIFIHARFILLLKKADGKKLDNPVKLLEGSPLLEGINSWTPFKSIKAEDVGEYWYKIKNLDTSIQDSLFLKLNCATVLRVGSQCKLTWNMLDRFKKQINIPKENMKTKKEFMTPVPNALVKELLAFKKLKNVKKDSEYIFTNRAETSHYNEDRASVLIKRNLGFDAQAHGHRTLFRDIKRIENKFPSEAIEFQLAHSKGSKESIENHYINDQNYLKIRKDLVDSYYNYLEQKASEYETIMNLGKAKVSEAVK